MPRRLCSLDFSHFRHRLIMSFHLYSAFSLFPFPLSFSTAQEQRVYFVLSRGNFAHPCDEASERKGSSDKDHWGETKMRIKGAFLCLYVHPWRKSFSEAGFSCSQFRHAFSLHFLLLSSLSLLLPFASFGRKTRPKNRQFLAPAPFYILSVSILLSRHLSRSVLARTQQIPKRRWFNIEISDFLFFSLVKWINGSKR